MEVDYRAVDEPAESAGVALLPSPQPLSLPPSESASFSSQGQQQIWKDCPTLSRLKLVLIDSPVCALCWYADAPLVSARLTARVDSVGKPACELCGRRLADVKHHRQHGNGRACHP